MNNSINYSGFVDLLMDSSDDFEPYGLSEVSAVEEMVKYGEVSTRLWLDELPEE